MSLQLRLGLEMKKFGFLALPISKDLGGAGYVC